MLRGRVVRSNTARRDISIDCSYFIFEVYHLLALANRSLTMFAVGLVALAISLPSLVHAASPVWGQVSLSLLLNAEFVAHAFLASAEVSTSLETQVRISVSGAMSAVSDLHAL